MNGPPTDPMDHCIAKIAAIVAEGRDDRRAILQLGYNLGRLSELTGLGRETFWDRWKDAVAVWDRPGLEALARELQHLGLNPHSDLHPRPDDLPKASGA